MRILLIGGAGFLGSQLLPVLAKNKKDRIQVFGTTRRSDPSQFLRKPNIEPHITGTINSSTDIMRVMEKFKPDVVVHLAAYNTRPENFGNFRTCAETNYLGTANVAHAILSLKQKPKKLIFASSLAASDPQSHFGIAKRAAEDLLLTTFGRVPELGVEVVILRFAEIYGSSPTHSTFSMVNWLTDQMLLNRNLSLCGVKEQWDFLHISDAVQACKLAIEGSPKEKVLDICTGELIPLKELIQQIKDLAGYKGQFHFFEDPRIPILTYKGDPELAREALGFSAAADFSTELSNLVKKRRKVLA